MYNRGVIKDVQSRGVDENVWFGNAAERVVVVVAFSTRR